MLEVLWLFSADGQDGGGSLVPLVRGPPGASVMFCLREAFQKPDPHGKDFMQRESIGTDMLLELVNSNYTRYHIELINRPGGGWLVSTLL